MKKELKSCIGVLLRAKLTEHTYSVVSNKQTGCNKRRGWSKFFFLVHEKKIRVVKKFHLVHEKKVQGGKKLQNS